MKVLFVCPFVPWPLVDGGKIRSFNLIKEASALAEIHLRVIHEPDEVPDAEEALAPWCASLEFFDRATPTRIARWTKPKLERWFHAPKLHAAVRQDLAGESFHLVHLDELLLARIVPAGAGVPVVQHHHKLDTVLYDSLWAHEGLTRHFDKWKLRRLEAESARRYRHHLLCCQEDADILRERYGALDCDFVPSGFDPELFQQATPPVAREPQRLLFLGSMSYGPNVDAVCHFVGDVLPRLRERRPELVFEIVGGNPVREVRELAGPGVVVTGRVPDVRPYLERAALMVVPLRIGGGTRLKIVEALALETPIVSTRIGAEGLGLEHDRHLLLADEPGAFAEGVLRLLDDPEHAGALGRRGCQAVHRRFRWDRLAQELLEYWERVAISGALSPSR